MYKVEVSFDTVRLEKKDIHSLCSQMDQIFEREDLECQGDIEGKRIYLDKGRKQDFGRFWAAIFAIKDSSLLVDGLKECFWYNGNTKENLMTDFLVG